MYRDGKELNESGKRYEFGKRYVFWKPLEKVNSHEVTGDLRYAITVIHDAHPRAFEELRMSDAELEVCRYFCKFCTLVIDGKKVCQSIGLPPDVSVQL